MQTFKKSLIASVVALGFIAGPALVVAHSHLTPEQQQERYEVKQAQKTEKRQVRLAQIEASLHLTAEQKPAWDKFAAAINKPVKSFETKYSMTNPATPAPERMKLHVAQAEARVVHMKAVEKELNHFYYHVLTEQQRVTFDQEWKGGKFHGKRKFFSK